MKTRLIRAAALACLLALLLPACALGATTYYVKTANGKSLNLRNDCGTDADIIAQIPYGAAVNVFEFTESDYWAFVEYNGKRGYCMTRYLTRTKPASGGGSGSSGSSGNTGSSESFKAFQKADYVAVVVPSTPSGYVNLRWMPSKTAAVQATYRAGDTLLVLSQSSHWCQVYDAENGICGFMMRTFLEQQ